MSAFLITMTCVAAVQLGTAAYRKILPLDGYIPRGSSLAIIDALTTVVIASTAAVMIVFEFAVIGLMIAGSSLDGLLPVAIVSLSWTVISGYVAGKTDASPVLAFVQEAIGVIAILAGVFLFIF